PQRLCPTEPSASTSSNSSCSAFASLLLKRPREARKSACWGAWFPKKRASTGLLPVRMGYPETCNDSVGELVKKDQKLASSYLGETLAVASGFLAATRSEEHTSELQSRGHL